ncbi:hypothetical protein SAMD00079811_82320 (plasmid) [Scytonema sp. HK-05]|uniref:hypothetical protein n=1 Tax=Scytonema sp. HK-05 TaxID=1137095 RepID=UPI0009362D61|nr:hypothetical protein [Scytonema sp. HK-05]OKH52394.1 hypothetical protein NIES2130_32165 [Scytonema sp. HK-05]BAY50603.1 hypothetical protein SAMD00079811_82320 [Scytonema sp. HK-05]
MVYQKQIGLALAGIAVCAAPVLLPLIPKIGTYAQSERLKAEEELQRATIAERAKTSEALYNAGIAPNATSLRIRRYLDSPREDPKPDTTGYGASEIVYVYDSAGVCIGKIEGNQWLWKHKYNNICKGDSN